MSENSMRICSHCLLPIHPSESGVRHYGTHTAHSEARCIALLRQEMAQLASYATEAIAEKERAESMIAVYVGAQEAAQALTQTLCEPDDTGEKFEDACRNEESAAEVLRQSVIVRLEKVESERDALAARVAAAEADARRFESLVNLLDGKQAGALHINQWLVMALSKRGQYHCYHADPPSGPAHNKASSVLQALRNTIDAALAAQEPT